jgi:hypothetical protein
MCLAFWTNLARAAFLAGTMFIVLATIVRHLSLDRWLAFWSLMQEAGVLIWISVYFLRALECDQVMAESLRIWEREILTSMGLALFGIGRVGVIFRARGLHRRGRLAEITAKTFGPPPPLWRKA